MIMAKSPMHAKLSTTLKAEAIEVEQVTVFIFPLRPWAESASPTLLSVTRGFDEPVQETRLSEGVSGLQLVAALLL